MMKYCIKQKLENEVEQNGKKILIYTGAVLAGVGAYLSYKAIKNHKQKSQKEDDYYLTDNECDIYNYDDLEENEKNELEEKVNEFNSRRINHDNSPHISKEEMTSYVNSVEDTKDDVQINKGDYREDEYDKYDYYEDHLEEK